MTDIEGLYLRYRSALLRQAAYLVRYEHAEDIVQNAFLRVLMWSRKYPEKVIGKGELSIAVWYASMSWKKARKQEAIYIQSDISIPQPNDPVEMVDSHPDPQPGPYNAACDATFLDAFYEAEHKLPHRQRECIKLVFIEGLTSSEAGEKLGITPNAVRVAIFAARKTLRKALKGWAAR